MDDAAAGHRRSGGRHGLRVAASVVGAILASLLILAGVVALLSEGSAGTPRNSLVGTKVQHFSVLPGVNRSSVSAPWRSHRASVLLFFANWCAPCHAELPALSRALGAGSYHGAEVVGIDADHSPSVAHAFVVASRTRFPVGQDANLVVAAPLVGAFPAAVFVSANGTITEVHYGAISAAQVRSGIDAMQRSATRAS